MSISNKCAEGLIWAYKGINRSGLLDMAFMRSLYISSYFTYKKYLEDPYARLAKYHQHLFKKGNILDIGANIGYTAFVFSKVIDETFKVFAFEPEKRNLEFLRQSSQKCGFENKLVSVGAAVGDIEGEIELWRNEGHNGDHRILTEELKKQLPLQFEVQKTPIVTVDSYLEKQNINSIAFVKIDVQGYELAVCKGMINTLERNPNMVVGFEYCPSIMESLGFQPRDLIQFFQERDYFFYVLNTKNKIQVYDMEKNSETLQQKKPHDYIDILCSRKNLII